MTERLQFMMYSMMEDSMLSRPVKMERSLCMQSDWVAHSCNYVLRDEEPTVKRVWWRAIREENEEVRNCVNPNALPSKWSMG